MYMRSLILPTPGTHSFFLWGPRQTGKSTLLQQRFPDAYWVDLLKNTEFVRYRIWPEMLAQELEALPQTPSLVVIDEVQKVPALLDEVHWLMENRGICFALCGSSARRVRRGGANLLGGRALRFELRGLTAAELDDAFDLKRMLNHGYLPRIYDADQSRQLLDAYIADYLTQEIAAEGLVRNLPVFAHFLQAAALSDGERVNFSNIARECGVTGHTVRSHFDILEDTLLGTWLPAFRRRVKRRVTQSPKFYFADVGIVNRLARRGVLEPPSENFGKAFENWVFHELKAFVGYRDIDEELSYWRLPSGIEVDFVIGAMRMAIEAKASTAITRTHLKGLRILREEHPQVQRRMVVSLERRPRRTPDGIDILPAQDFAARLWQGALI